MIGRSLLIDKIHKNKIHSYIKTLKNMFQFYDAWKTLCDWLDSSSGMLAKFVNPSYASKQDIEDLKVSNVSLISQFYF